MIQQSIFIILIAKVISQEIENLPSCYNGPVHHSTKPLEDILVSERRPKEDKTIFFHIPNCWYNGYINLSSRQACAVESAAVNNPNFDIFVIFAGPTYQPKNLGALPIISSLMSYENIFFRRVNISSYADDPDSILVDDDINQAVEGFFDPENLESLPSNLLQYLKLITSLRFGGIVMDLDVIVKKSLEHITFNFVGADTSTSLNDAVFSFGYSQTEYMISSFVREVEFQEAILHGCGVKSVKDMTFKKCKGLHKFEPAKFYPLSFSRLNYLFEEKFLEKALKITEKSYLIHTWEELTQKYKVGSQSLYGVLADLHCPKVYFYSGKYF